MKIGIIGAGGHGGVVGDIAYELGYKEIYYFDDYLKKKNFHFHGSFVGKLKKISLYKNLSFIVAYGDNYKREQIYKQLEKDKYQIVSLIHPKASISFFSKIAKGCVIMSNVSINNNVKISKGCIINTGSIIDHDCIIERFSHICPGVYLAGNVKISNNSFVGIGSRIVQKINVGSNVVIGAGSIITKNIKSNVTAYNKKNIIINEKT